MEDKSIGIFYAIKWRGDTDCAVQEFMREYCDTDFCYSRTQVENIVRDAIMDYISNAYNPIREMRRYFNTWKEYSVRNEFDVMLHFIYNTAVRNDGKYIDGFKDNPFKKYKVFKEFYEND